jgi:hypothetical protein
MNYAIAHVHVEGTIIIAERPPHVDQVDIRSANLRQQPVDMICPGAPFEDRIYSWYDSIGCRRHGLRRGGDDMPLGSALVAERPDPLDISAYYSGDHRVDVGGLLLGQLHQMDSDIDLPETEQDVIPRAGLEGIRQSELTDDMARHAAELNYLIDAGTETASM